MSELAPTPPHGELVDLLGDDATSLLTPFEAWCEARGLHPESPLAWQYYRLSLDMPPAC